MIKFLGMQFFAEDDPADKDTPPEGTDGGDKDPKEKDGDKDDKLKPKYTDEDIDRIISARFARWEKDHQKKVDEAKKLAEMNATEKAEYEAQKLRDELEELKRKETLAEMSKEARKMCEEAKVNITDDLLEMIISTDSEKTKAAVESFIKLFDDAVQAAVKDALKGNPPKKGAGDSTIAKDDIMKVKDRHERQRLIKENMELFKPGGTND